MSAVRQLLLVGATASVALLVVAVVVAGVFVVGPAPYGNSYLGRSSVFGTTMLLGAPPALLVGVPAYVGLLRTGQARWYYVLAIGVLPGLVLLSLDALLGVMAIACGAIVSMSTHLACRRLGRAPGAPSPIERRGVPLHPMHLDDREVPWITHSNNASPPANARTPDCANSCCGRTWPGSSRCC